MDENNKVIIDLLLELKNAPRDDAKALIRQYNMIFMGKSFNKINSLELAHYLKKYRKASISHEYLLETLPKIAALLGMELEPMIAVDDIGKSEKTTNFLITLF